MPVPVFQRALQHQQGLDVLHNLRGVHLQGQPPPGAHGLDRLPAGLGILREGGEKGLRLGRGHHQAGEGAAAG